MLLQTLIILYLLYTLLKVAVAVSQYRFVRTEVIKKPVVLEPETWRFAARYSMAKERLNMTAAFLEGLLFVFWVLLGLPFLDTLFSDQEGFIKALFVVNSFMVINYLLG